MLKLQLENASVLNFYSLLIFSILKTVFNLAVILCWCAVAKIGKFIAPLHKARSVPEVVVIPRFCLAFLSTKIGGMWKKPAC